MNKEKIGVGYNLSSKLLCVYDNEKDLHIKIEKVTIEKVKLNVSYVLKNETIIKDRLFNTIYDCFNYCIDNNYFDNVKLTEIYTFIEVLLSD